MNSNYIEINDRYKCIFIQPKIWDFEITRVPLWQLPFNKRYKDFDEDNSKWFESKNKNGNDEISIASDNLRMSFSRYQVQTKYIYEDNTFKGTNNIYPNGITVKETNGKNHVIVSIKNRHGQLIAEKVYSRDSNEGRKTIYKNAQNGNNIFTVVQNFSYDITKNRHSDATNYAFSLDDERFVDNCQFENEYYLLNGKQVKAKKIGENKYKTTDDKGNKLTFIVE